MVKVYTDGDVRVKINSHLWTFNPNCCSLVPNGQYELNNTLGGGNEREEEHGKTLHWKNDFAISVSTCHVFTGLLSSGCVLWIEFVFLLFWLMRLVTVTICGLFWIWVLLLFIMTFLCCNFIIAWFCFYLWYFLVVNIT